MTARPNILVLMTDQLNGTLFPDGPADWLRTPNLRALAASSARFANCYTASPLCAPGRASFMTGRLPHRTRVYDNAAEFASDLPTFAHHLRRAGYWCGLSGKMHFVGPDQLHGFEERMTTDVYPADFGWTPDYRRPDERVDWWYHNLGSVTGAGVAEISNQLEYDDEVAALAVQKLYQLARGEDDRPWMLTVSFTHPHDPYVARRRFWDLYGDGDAPLAPEIAPISLAESDPHSQRLMRASDCDKFDIRPEHVARARRAYFANISYLDEKIGEILRVLDDTRQTAAVMFCSDHGDMLGERGLWFKMNFREGSARVPLTLRAPDVPPGRVDAPVSTLDVCPTLAAVAGIPMEDVAPWTDGEDLLPLARGGGRDSPVMMEYAAEGSRAPMVCLRRGRWKHIHCDADPPQLFDLDADPQETRNLAESHPDILAEFDKERRALWDLARFDAEVRDSQARRLAVYQSLRRGAHYPWDFQPLQRASERYMRNHLDLNELEERRRFPRGE